MALSRNERGTRGVRDLTRLEIVSRRDFIVKREFHIELLLLIIILYHAAGSVALNLPLSYVIVSLLLDLQAHLGGLHVSCKITFATLIVLPDLRVPRFDPRPTFIRPRRPNPFVESDEEDSDETLVN